MYIMQKKTQLLILAIILFVLLLITSVYSCCSFEPYSFSSPFTNNTLVEGNTPMESKTSLSSAFITNTEQSVNNESEEEKGKKVEGFEGLKPSLYSEEKEIDSFSKTKGSIACIGDSSGLHNSLGALCLSEQQKNLLSTRGGNAKSGEAAIGGQ